MNYIVSIDKVESSPLDLAQVVQLYQSGALKRNSRVRKDLPDAEWSTLEKTLPFISSMRTLDEFITRLSERADLPVAASIRKVDLGFWDWVGLIFKIVVASIPAAILLFVLFAALNVVLVGVLKGMSQAVR